MIWNGYGPVYTVLREGSVTVRARDNEGRYVLCHCVHDQKVAKTKMDDILKYWFRLARKRKRSNLRCLESDQICIRARLRGKSKRSGGMSILTTMLLCNSTVERSICQIPRTSAWFDLAYATYSGDEWYAHFQMSRSTFDFLVDDLQPYLKGKETQMRKPVEVKRKVGLFLYFIATTAEYRILGNLFGVSTAFVRIWIRKVALAIKKQFSVPIHFIS